MIAENVSVGLDGQKRAHLLALAKHLMERGRRRAEGKVRVTDLLFPRRAYFSITHPEIGLTERETGFFLAGRGHHQLLQFIASLPEFHEVVAEWENVVGHVDLLGDVPSHCAKCGGSLCYAADLRRESGTLVLRCKGCGHGMKLEEYPIEIKTTRSMRVASPAEIQQEHSHYLDQLSMYCALTNHRRGKLLVFYLNVREPDNSLTPKLVVYDCAFGSLDAIKAQMLERKAKLLESIELGNPSGLEPCPDWMCIDCKYRELCKGDPRIGAIPDPIGEQGPDSVVG